jgi:hypothetical protein
LERAGAGWSKVGPKPHLTTYFHKCVESQIINRVLIIAHRRITLLFHYTGHSPY